MIFADYMPMPWWFLPAMFSPLWAPVVLAAIIAGLIDLGRRIERRQK